MEKPIHKFIDEFLTPSKKSLRCKVLKNHETGLGDEVSDGARQKLGTMELMGSFRG